MADMTIARERVTRALEAGTFRDVRSALGFPRPTLTLSEVQQLNAHLDALPGERQTVRIGTLHTYTTELLRPYWSLEAGLAGFRVELYEAPLGSLLQEGQAGSGLRGHGPDSTFLFLQWSDLEPGLAPGAPPGGRGRGEALAQAEQRLIELVGPLRDAVPGLLVVTILPRRATEGGIVDSSASEPSPFEAEGSARIADALRRIPATHFVDLDRVLTESAGSSPFDPRLWRVAAFPFSVLGAQTVVRALFERAWLLKGALTKCVVLDADNTLWGGIVGEDGLDGIALGPSPPGDAYVAFQRKLLALRERGILLALCSRNNPGDVQEVLARHPHQVLREEHFASTRVNWEPKVRNIRSIARELNLGLENLLFVDDSPRECLLAQQQIPELSVIRVPEPAASIPTCLDGWPGFERLSLTAEDADRAQYYLDAQRRRDLEVRSETVEEYLAALRMVMTVGLDELGAAPRIAQLTQKTNQFNLTTRRCTEAEILRWMRDPDRLVAHFSLADVCGDNGIVGVAILRGVSGEEPVFDNFLLSCRVIGRTAETAFLGRLLEVLQAGGARRVRGTYLPTPKNALVADFWPRHGFGETAPGKFEKDLHAHAGAAVARGPIEVVLAGVPSPGPPVDPAMMEPDVRED
jgi:FkbH-like protein